jgi:hypothetical protein
VSSFERHFHSIEIPFPIGPARRPVGLLFASIEVSKRISARGDERDETIVDWCEGRQIVQFRWQ